MDWEAIIKKVPAGLEDLALWLSDLPFITFLSSFGPTDFILDVLGIANRARSSAFAAQIAFFFLMTLFPFVILMLQLLRTLPISQESLLYAVDSIFPIYLVSATHSILQEVFSTSFGLVPLTIITMLWTTSKVMHAMIVGLDLICTTEGSRNWLVVRAWSLLCTFLLILVVLMIAASMVIWQPLREMLLRNRPYGVSLAGFSTLIRMLYTFFVGTLALTTIYKILPRRHLRFFSQVPGAFAAVVAIYFFTAFVSVYVGRFNGFSAYGSLTTLTLVMFWMYFSCYFIMLGAIVNEVVRLRRSRRKEAQTAA